MYGKFLETTTGCVIGGAGPAGMGLLFNALRTGAIAELAQYGLIIVDASASPGVGRLGDYQITANSVGDVFLDCLRDPAMADVFAPLQQSPAYWRIFHQAQQAPLLSEVGELLLLASQLVLDHIVAHYNVQLWSETLITEVIRDNDQYQVWVEHRGQVQRIRTGSLVLNLGGRQDPRCLVDGLKAQGLQAPALAAVRSADSLLRMSPAALRECFAPVVARGGDFVVVGGSHSAFSMLENIASALEPVGLQSVSLVHRSPIRLFYESLEQARANGYEFDPVADVCPISGRVNRSGGLRYRALDVGRQVLERGYVGSTSVRARLLLTDGSDPAQTEAASQVLGNAAVVMQCTGYQPLLPVLRRGDGTVITLRQVTGGLDSDASGCPCDDQGRRLHGLHLFGLGSGLGVDPLLGSEPSFSGRIYGVWQFHHDASRVVIDAVLQRLADLASPQPAIVHLEVGVTHGWPQELPDPAWGKAVIR
ncbi:pyridine nucleotide-disulfide oxidoreductase [Pseudomonas eucalypticola]|uniref:Pyridine nucleotide-disulfide oxidoreductase n=1 Tax=Pseudomonas eucalypticola TaxID=2599595 RepID=A0A7D5H302_9PSED|nr:pyridine nucleotide-disulfide oxidoreductase [Pseudomonas eucalypticola]QKZ06585.1 pyridine nucleotide-disulfide oxidoreductase [Pseudomonas eucalypticola]